MTANAKPTPQAQKLRIADLDALKPTTFEVVLPLKARETMAVALGLVSLKKLRFVGEIAPSGAADWVLRADLGATAVQECVLTLEPVTTRIDTLVGRQFLAYMDQPSETEEELEMPEDDSHEPLGTEIDLMTVIRESLALALPPYPKSDGARLTQGTFTEPGKAAMKDADTLPFAGLAALRDSLKKQE